MPGRVLVTIVAPFLFRKISIIVRTFSFLVVAMCLFTLPGCTKAELESSTGLPENNYEIMMKTPGELEPVIAKFHIVRMVNAGNNRYVQEYYDISKAMVIRRTEAERTMSLRMMVHILNPAGLNISLTSKMKSLVDDGNWTSKEEVLYSGNDKDIQRFIDCPVAVGQYTAGLWVYRDKFMLFEFADFSYIVE